MAMGIGDFLKNLRKVSSSQAPYEEEARAVRPFLVLAVFTLAQGLKYFIFIRISYIQKYRALGIVRKTFYA
jgi:hypothetical protein